MSFYKRSFHSFLDQTKAKTMPFKDHETSQPPSKPCEFVQGHNEIIGSISRNLGGIGFADEADGLMLCTEYLGFESYDMRMSDNEVENKMTSHAEEETERVKTKENVVAQERKREFPPPLSSLNGRGQRSFYLRPVRKDGRLELTQVMVDRQEIFHASREDGRLRLHLVDSNPMRAYCDDEEIVEFEDEPKGLDNENDTGNICRFDLESGREFNEDESDANDVVSDQVLVDLSMINDYSGAKSWRCESSNEVMLNTDHDADVTHFHDADVTHFHHDDDVTHFHHDDDVTHFHHDDDVTHFHDEHDAREWRYKSCYNIVASRNYDGNHHHHHRHHIHPYHHPTSNNNMHLWSGTYVKTR